MTPQSGSAAPANAQTIARNSFWLTLELVFSLFGAFITSIVVARAIGPVRLGDFSFIVLLTNVTTAVGAFGLPTTTRKYMAEYLNRGKNGVAKSIYWFALGMQLWIAAALTVIGLLVVLFFAKSGVRAFSALLVMTMAPRMIGFIPSQANNAAEVMRRNTPPTLLGNVVTITLTLFGLWIGWDLPGVAGAQLAGASLETGLKLRSVQQWLGGITRDAVPSELRRQIWIYSRQGFALMLLNIVVWDRSDVVFLKFLNSDIRQVTFFSIAFNLTERMLIIPSAFAQAVSATMMAQYGRGEQKLPRLTVESARYSFLIGLPLLAGMACVSGPAILILYGGRFRPMIPVLAVVAVMAIPKALIGAPTALLQTVERQAFLVRWGWICGSLDVLLDVVLVPRSGALGAAFANGTAQTFCAFVLWAHVYRRFGLDLRLKAFGKIALSGAIMSAAAAGLAYAIPGYRGLAAAVVAGALAWLALLRWTGALDGTDRQRFLAISKAVPARFRPASMAAVDLLAPSCESFN